jgi:hypothetical protein
MTSGPRASFARPGPFRATLRGAVFLALSADPLVLDTALSGIVHFSATVLRLYSPLVVKQPDESLKPLSITAVNVIESELAEYDSLEQAAREMDRCVSR